MKRIVDEFITMADNPPKAHETREEIQKKKDVYEDLKNSLIKISRNFFSEIQLKEMKQGLQAEYEDLIIKMRTGQKLEDALNHMFPGAENRIINIDESEIKDKIKKIEGLLAQVCEILTVIEIAETTGIIKPNA